MEILILYRGDLASDVLVAEMAEECMKPDDEEAETSEEGIEADETSDKQCQIGVLTFSGYLTKTAMAKLIKLAEKYPLAVYDYGMMVEAMDNEGEGKGFLPFEKEVYSLYAYQIVVAGALCKKLAIQELYVPSYDEGEGQDRSIPDIAVLVKFARKTVIHSTNRAVDVVSPFSELSSGEIKKLAKKYGV